MYGIFTYIHHKNQLNVGKYTIHGWYGKQHTHTQQKKKAKRLPQLQTTSC